MTALNLIYNAKYYFCYYFREESKYHFCYYFREENTLNTHCCVNWYSRNVS